MEEEEVMMEVGVGKSQKAMNSWSKVVGPIPATEGFDLCSEEMANQYVKIICYLLGSNPPLMDGYFRRIWKNRGIDKLARVNKGVFLVRFQSEESKIRIVEEGVQIFDKKPVVTKP